MVCLHGLLIEVFNKNDVAFYMFLLMCFSAESWQAGEDCLFDALNVFEVILVHPVLSAS